MLLVICQLSHDVACSRLQDSQVHWIEKMRTHTKKAGEQWREEKATEPVIISLNGLFRYTSSWYNLWVVTSTLPKQVVPVTQKEGARLPCAWSRRIHNNFCVEQILVFKRFPTYRSAEEGTRPSCLVNLACEKDVSAILPTSFGGNNKRTVVRRSY